VPPTSSCRFCGQDESAPTGYCASCGASRNGVELVRLVPAVLVGSAVAASGLFAGREVATPGGGGLVAPIAQLVLGSTVPHFAKAFAFLGGVAATFSLAAPQRRDTIFIGAMLLALHAVVVTSVFGRVGPLTADPSAGIELLLLGIGVLVAAPAAGSEALRARFGRWFSWLPGTRPVRSGLAVVLGAAILMAAYFAVVTAIMIAIVVLIVYFGFQFIFGSGRRSGGGGPPVITDHFGGGSGGPHGPRGPQTDAWPRAPEPEKPLRELPLLWNTRLWDETGQLRGRIDDSGRRWNVEGVPLGRIDEEGKFWDEAGTYRGHVDEFGQTWNERGERTGSIGEDGRRWDESGRPQGRHVPD